MREQVRQSIDGVEYGLIALSPFKSARILTRLTKMGAGPLLKALTTVVTDTKSSGESVLDREVDEIFPIIADLLSPVFEKMQEDDIELLTKEILAPHHFFVGDKKIMNAIELESHFGQHGVLHMLKVLKFGLGVNFSDFLPVLQGVGNVLNK